MTGFNSKRDAAADKQKLWDKPSVAFDEWWNGDNDESTNPYRLESGAYWAWAGWKAALAQPAQERNFCSRCGKRTADLTVIHTCTPPQGDA